MTVSQILTRAAGEVNRGAVEGATPDAACAFAPSTTLRAVPLPRSLRSRGGFSR